MNDSFLSRNPVWEEAGFFGRAEELAWVVDKLGRQSPENCNVVGEPRIGKSSFLYRLYRQWTGVTVWLRLVELPEHDSAVFWQTLWAGWQGVGGQAAVFYDDARTHFDALDEAISEFIESAGSQRIVFFIDDFDLLVDGIGQRDLDWLRSLTVRYGEQLAFVIGSTEPLAVLTGRIGETAVSPLANLFHNLSLGLLTTRDATALCQAVAIAEGARFTTDEIAFLLQEVGAHPDLLKVACGHLLAAKRAGQRGRPLLETVSAEVRVDGHVQWLCQRLLARRTVAEQAMLVALANGRSPGDTILLTHLKRIGLVTDTILFADAFRYWLRRETADEPEQEQWMSTISHIPEKKLVMVEEREVRLTPLENRLLAYFLQRANEVCTIEELLADIWGEGKTRSVVEKGVSRLREKIEVDPKRPRYLLSAWGEGYLLRTAVGQEKV